MTTEKTIVVHTERPGSDAAMYIMAYNKHNGQYEQRSRIVVRERWDDPYTAWYDPQIGEVEPKAKFVVRRNGVDKYDVLDAEGHAFVACEIPNRAAAQRIADIYNEVAG